MIHVPTDQFQISTRLYAVRPDSLSFIDVTDDDNSISLYRCSIEAVWFGRKHQSTYAAVGELWYYEHSYPRDYLEFTSNHIDGRYGGKCRSRWNGTNSDFWTTDYTFYAKKDLKLLQLMLDNYPQVPEGFNGWWGF